MMLRNSLFGLQPSSSTVYNVVVGTKLMATAGTVTGAQIFALTFINGGAFTHLWLRKSIDTTSSVQPLGMQWSSSTSYFYSGLYQNSKLMIAMIETSTGAVQWVYESPTAVSLPTTYGLKSKTQGSMDVVLMASGTKSTSPLVLRRILVDTSTRQPLSSV